jgi:hypothetical protein
MIIPSFILLLIESIIFFRGVHFAIQLRQSLTPRPEGASIEPVPDLTASTTVRASSASVYTSLFAAWWQVECVLFILLQLFSLNFNIPELAAQGYNLGLHGGVVFILSHFRSSVVDDYEKTRKRIRYYFTFYSMFCLLSLIEVLCSVYAFYDLLYTDWPLLVFCGVTGMRFIISCVVMNAFRIAGVKNYREMKLHQQQMQEKTEILFEKVEEEENLLKVEEKEVLVPTGLLSSTREMSVKLGVVLMGFVAYLVLFGNNPVDMLGMIGNFPVSNVGSHISAYAVCFHFPVVFVGYCVTGAEQHNQGHLTFAILVCVSSVLVSIATVAVSIIYGVTPHEYFNPYQHAAMYIGYPLFATLFVMSVIVLILLIRTKMTLSELKIPTITRVW